MTTNMTKHASIERYDRISAIIDLMDGDVGEVIIRVWDSTHCNFQELTSKGVLIARGENNVVITMFLCSVRKARMIGETSGKMLTRNQWRRIHENQKYQKLCA